MARYGQPFPGVPGRGMPSISLTMPAAGLSLAFAAVYGIQIKMGVLATVPPSVSLFHLLLSGGQDTTREGRGSGAKERSHQLHRAAVNFPISRIPSATLAAQKFHPHLI